MLLIGICAIVCSASAMTEMYEETSTMSTAGNDGSSCIGVKDPTMTSEALKKLSADYLGSCLALLGKDKLQEQQAADIWSRLLEVNGGAPEYVPEYLIRHLGWIAIGIPSSHMLNLTMTDVDTVSALGVFRNLSEAQLSALAQAFREQWPAKEPEDWTDIDLAIFGNILCGFNESDILRMHADAYKLPGKVRKLYQRNLWLGNAGLTEDDLPKDARFCEVHFILDDFERLNFQNLMGLKSNAVPTRFGDNLSKSVSANPAPEPDLNDENIIPEPRTPLLPVSNQKRYNHGQEGQLTPVSKRRKMAALDGRLATLLGCNNESMQALAKLAVSADAFGEPQFWDRAHVRAVGCVLSGLPVESVTLIPADAMAGLSADSARCLPSRVTSALTSDQLSNLSPGASAAISGPPKDFDAPPARHFGGQDDENTAENASYPILSLLCGLMAVFWTAFLWVAYEI